MTPIEVVFNGLKKEKENTMTETFPKNTERSQLMQGVTIALSYDTQWQTLQTTAITVFLSIKRLNRNGLPCRKWYCQATLA